ncbi:MAG: hypothetical protein HQL57_00035 [Magnetococcales bacterium]|nr:hypothetical protein [Magnetococcales bacterium]MBF0155561.1 hypothetical protein [Magnetococcales bacterium]
MDATGQVSKPEVIRALLEQEGRVLLCLDARHSGVLVPRRLKGDAGLRLILNRTMPQPIHIGETAVESELRFGGVPHYCVIPYESLWGAFNPDSGRGTLWPESMPESIRRGFAGETEMDPPPETHSPQGGPLTLLPEIEPQRPKLVSVARPALRVIESEPPGGNTPGGGSGSGAPRGRRRGEHLRVVK